MLLFNHIRLFYIKNILNFNTSNVTIQQRTWEHYADGLVYFNTSNVTIQQDITINKKLITKFQYI